MTEDTVNHPSHYTQGEVECIDAIKSALTEEEFRGFCKGNAFKYIWREKHKGQDESLKKAIWYLNRLQEVYTSYSKEEAQKIMNKSISEMAENMLVQAKTYPVHKDEMTQEQKKEWRETFNRFQWASQNPGGKNESK